MNDQDTTHPGSEVATGSEHGTAVRLDQGHVVGDGGLPERFTNPGLPAHVARMADLMLTGRRDDADEDAAAGLSQYVVDDGTGLDVAIDLASRVADNAAQTNFAIIQALPRIAEAAPREGYFMEAMMAAIAQGTDDAKTRMQDFLDGRAEKVTDR